MLFEITSETPASGGVLDFIAFIQPEKAYLTHISHIFGFHEEIQKKLPKNVFLAYDTLEITI
jgi:phosphoribosyl 1,2-cyclic phosphate phosphodiesterase